MASAEEQKEKAIQNVTNQIESSPLLLPNVFPSLPPSLLDLFVAIGNAVAKIGYEVRTEKIETVGTTNLFGDSQLTIDVVSDKIVFDHLKKSGVVHTAASEESPKEVHLGGKGYSVSFDPLDGSSVISANFAVGSIFGIWEGDHLVGRKGSEQVASIIAMYGPRIEMTIAVAPNHVSEFTLDHEGKWHQTSAQMKVADQGKIFAPGNLRCVNSSPKYQELIQFWIASSYTLRYTGGMVPDVHHILSKGKGVFCNYGNKKSPFKLRLLYECAPIALLFECAGAMAVTASGDRLLDLPMGLDTRCGICVGSKEEVNRFIEFMKDADD
eukprot:CAMPEP_0201491944 /NCGR_PEP_ID=MMETSP0151_2-20130828/31871_1 /ASSEMBLY_ACC=CAM_ASM_000257 /TAXON_ID=200890 /ORGANISM="Paramoeba atlantica, Strain 621/1 / CCAP 1560/9" /LENGTH=324 /DNA_ID=CAMNT_0047878565 /DNA_START=48 /DNA_END=1022 /DNA_ORIENTATION=+